MRVRRLLGNIIIPVTVGSAALGIGCEMASQEAPVETPTAKAPESEPKAQQAPATGLLDEHVPPNLQTATFALG